MEANSSKTVLAVELGSTCGFAVGGMTYMFCGSSAYSSFESRMAEFHDAAPVGRVYCVDGGVKGRAKSEALRTLAKQWGVEVEFVKRSAISRSFVDKGNASAADILEECRARDFEPRSDQEAGAFALFDLALRQH